MDKKTAKLQDQKHKSQFQSKSAVVLKLNAQRDLAPTQLSGDNFYYRHRLRLKELRNRLLSQDSGENWNFEGVKVTPLKLIGTQRTDFTHRKDRSNKKIPKQIARMKAMSQSKSPGKQASVQPGNTEAAAAEEGQKEDKEMFVDEQDSEYVSILLVKCPNLTQNGFGTRYQLLVPEGYGQQVLRRMVYSGCRAIALKEYLAINLECR